MVTADATVAEIVSRFTERSLVLCGDEFVAVKQTEDVAPKMNLLDCVHTKVCGAVFEKLQACSKADAKAECTVERQALMLCVKAAYSSLPGPGVSVADVRRRRDELLAGKKI